ncbi:tetratricopeptide repeat protein 4-like [Rhopilema esculentum]|uniref:tetratricopeptide repeat protein 4-like n=1 Tax=Rhopilema esculentum TaxID=499914 RepID=UPI0031E2DD98
MATGKSEENSELVEQLQQEFQEHLKGVFEKNKEFKYSGGLTAENFEEEIRKVPAFINEAPTQEEIDASPALAALQALKYEETDPHECALAHKEDGNHHFKHNKYDKAVTAYSEGLKQKFDEVDLRVILLTNRAVANFYLENHRSSLNDSLEALKLNDTHMKAILRAAMSCFELKRFDDCIQWCDNGLQIDANEKRLVNLRQKSIGAQKSQDRDKRKREASEKKIRQKTMRLASALEERHINIEGSEKEKSSSDLLERIKSSSEHQPQDGKLYIDESNQLHWPVYFLYPEFNQSDFIEDFCENHRFIDHLDLMFDAACPPDWDQDKKYRVENLQLFYEDRQRNKCVEVSLYKTLKGVLSDKRYVVRCGAPGFLVLSKASDFYENFKKTMEIES